MKSKYEPQEDRALRLLKIGNQSLRLISNFFNFLIINPALNFNKLIFNLTNKEYEK
jgi:hypothetical protein